MVTACIQAAECLWHVSHYSLAASCRAQPLGLSRLQPTRPHSHQHWQCSECSHCTAVAVQVCVYVVMLCETLLFWYNMFRQSIIHEVQQRNGYYWLCRLDEVRMCMRSV